MPNSSPISSISQTHASSSSVFSTQPRVLSSISHLSQGSTSGPNTSIYRVGLGKASASTSIFHPGAAPASAAEGDSDEVRDRLRYQYIQKKMQQKRAVEAAQSDIEADAIRTGGGFSRRKFHKGLIHMKYGRPDKYKNLSTGDLRYFENLIAAHARSLKTGGGFSNNTKLRMKRQLWKDSKAGTVSSHSDRKDMENLINNLPSSGY